MSNPTLSFLENFYTGVTLYMPAEPAQSAPTSDEAPAAAAPVVAAETAPAAEPVIAPKAPPEAPPALPVLPAVPRLPPAVALPGPAPVAAPAPDVLPGPAPGALPMSPAPAVTPFLATPATAPAPAVAIAPTASPPPSPHLLTPFSTLGSNPTGVVLLVRLPPDEFVKLPRNVFLNKMLQALGFVMADVVLVNVESHLVVALSSLRREIAATHIIAFGRDLLDVTLRTTQIYEPVQFPSLGLSYLSSATVDSVEYDTSLKKRLWPGLQRMFPV